MTVKELLGEQLAACHDTNGWFVSMRAALEGLDAARASRRPDGSQHSAWQIVNHLAYWNDRYLRRFRGQQVERVMGETADTFDAWPAEGSEEEWRAARGRYDEGMRGLRDELAKAGEKRLDEPLRKDSPEPWASAFLHLAIHNAYHIGQVVTVRKAQGSWDSAQGVS
jgi:uncharacterized damage-inducible protein DinB